MRNAVNHWHEYRRRRGRWVVICAGCTSLLPLNTSRRMKLLTFFVFPFPLVSVVSHVSVLWLRPSTEAVRLSDPGLHQALHRPQLATETRQGSLRQGASGEGGQGETAVVFLHLYEHRMWLFLWTAALDTHINAGLVSKPGFRLD